MLCPVLCCCSLHTSNNTITQTAAKPGDIEALRLLGESRLLNAEPAKSVAAYETAIALAPNDQSLITVSSLGQGDGVFIF